MPQLSGSLKVRLPWTGQHVLKKLRKRTLQELPGACPRLFGLSTSTLNKLALGDYRKTEMHALLQILSESEYPIHPEPLSP